MIKKILRPVYHFPGNIRRARLNKRSKVNPKPLFVIGNQKSGTSAIGALLAQAVGRSVAIDLPDMKEPNQVRIHEGTYPFEEFIQNNRYDFSRQIIKEPSLTFLMDEVKEHFPDSKFVFIVRDPRDNIRSILNRADLRGDLENIDNPDSRARLKKVPKAWERVIDSRWLGVEGENYIEWMAHRWNMAMEIYEKYADDMILIRYEDFVKDKEGKIRELAEKVGMTPYNDISSKVDIQYQPAGNRKVDKKEFFGEKNLERIETICASGMKKYGYE